MTVVKRRGFTLAELLVALGVLGVMATFTIPKVLTSAAISKNRAITKETMATMSEAYMQLKINTAVNENTSAQDLAPYINYIKEDNTLQYDMVWGPQNCNGTYIKCYVMANGSLIALWGDTFSNTSNNNATFYDIDPDGPGPEKGLEFALYYNGRQLDTENWLNPTTSIFGSFGPWAGSVPDWFTYN